MGCVLCKLADGDCRQKADASEEPIPTRPAAGKVRKGTKRSGPEQHGHVDVPAGCRQYILSPSLPTAPGDWPEWLTSVAGEAIQGWVPHRADSFQKLAKIGQGTYSNVYKARELKTGRIVALKKVRFDNLEPESVKFMAREITLLRRLDHPNVIKLEGIVISRVACSLYLIFEYMEHDLAGLAASPNISFSLSEIKCYMKQLFSGLEHCHSRGVMHRDVKGANLLINNNGILKIADFGLASSYDPNDRRPMTSRVVTLWYRPPELLLGATNYGFAIDLWSAGCILAEMLSGKPILPGRTEVEQLHKIFKLCGTPSENYWKKLKLPRATMINPQQSYRRSVEETFTNFPLSSVPLIDRLLAIDPNDRGTATDALNSEFFNTEPYACDPCNLPSYSPTKEMDIKLGDEESRRKRYRNKDNGGAKKNRHHRHGRAIPDPEANAELQISLDRRRLRAQLNVKSHSEKFPPPHKDGAVSIPLAEASSNRRPLSFIAPDKSFTSSIFDPQGLPDAATLAEDLENPPRWQPLAAGSSHRRKKAVKTDAQVAPAQPYVVKHLKPMTGLPDVRKKSKIYKRVKGKEIEVFGGVACS